MGRSIPEVRVLTRTLSWRRSRPEGADRTRAFAGTTGGAAVVARLPKLGFHTVFSTGLGPDGSDPHSPPSSVKVAPLVGYSLPPAVSVKRQSDFVGGRRAVDVGRISNSVSS